MFLLLWLLLTFQETEVWLCPVHRDVQSVESGQCNICDRNLEKRRFVPVWSCPMHSEVTGEEGEACSICNMALARTTQEIQWLCPRHSDVRADNIAMVRDVTISIGDSCVAGTRPVATWLPGQRLSVLPDGLAEELPAGATLAVDVHYRKTWRDDGKAMTDKSRLGLYFEPDAATVSSLRMDGEDYELPTDFMVLAVYPSPTANGPFELEARYPDGHRAPLIRIRDFDRAWKAKYVFVRPLRLPRGSVLSTSSPATWVDYIPASD